MIGVGICRRRCANCGRPTSSGRAGTLNRLQKNYSDDVTNFDAIFNQAMMMADTLTNGIEKQFPNRFM